MRRALLAAAIAALTLPATASASFTQEPGSPFDVGFHPIGIYSTDFNGDARPDLLTIDETTVSVLRRGAGGGYALEAPPINLGANTGPSGAAIANFNADGRPDVAVANIVSSNVVILLRTASGGFTSSSIALGFQPGAIAAGDFIGSGATDLAVTDYFGGGGLQLLTGDGNGGFVPSPTLLPTGANPRRIAVANFDGIGGADLAITNAGSSSVTVLLRNGASFTQEVGSPIPIGASPQSLLARDFNSDGRPDLAIAEFGTDTARLLLRRSTGGFTNAPGSPVRVGDGPVGIASGDFNLDGRPDLVTANQQANTASVRLRTATGFVGDATPEVATDTGASAVAVVDANADGRQDLAVANYTDNSVSLLLNSTPPPPPPPPANRDKDGDGVQTPTDCNDNNPAIRPGVKDKPGDGIDQDCSGRDARYPLLARSIIAFTSTYPSARYSVFTKLKVKPVRKGDRIKLTCKGPGCKLKSKKVRVTKRAADRSLLRYLRGAKLREGATVQLRVTHKGTVGRVRTWHFRASKPPRSTTKCLSPGKKKPGRCPRR